MVIRTRKPQGMEIESSPEMSDICLTANFGVRLFFANFIRPFPKLVEDEAEGGSSELRAGECEVRNGGVDCERA